MQGARIPPWVVLSALALLVASACTGSDPITPSTAGFHVVVEMQNTGSRFEQAFLTIRQILVEAVDPEMDAASPQRIGLINNVLTFEMNGNKEGLQFEIPTVLPTGLWRIREMTFDTIDLIDAEAPAGTNCRDYIARYHPNAASTATVTFGDNDAVFDIGTDDEIVLRFKFPELLNAIQASFICLPSFLCGGPLWCLSPGAEPHDFIPTTLNNQRTEFLEIE